MGANVGGKKNSNGSDTLPNREIKKKNHDSVHIIFFF